MNIWITSDTHFGHSRLVKLAGRPNDFNNRILRYHSNLIQKSDILIHLGDFCIGDDRFWHKIFMAEIKCRKWLVRGNHDKKTDTWYLKHGWDFAGHSIILKKYSMNILFTHIPQSKQDYFDLNIHGHCHNTNRQSINDDKHILISLEHDYIPRTLKSIIRKRI